MSTFDLLTNILIIYVIDCEGINSTDISINGYKINKLELHFVKWI
jgi:hypothetical protein